VVILGTREVIHGGDKNYSMYQKKHECLVAGNVLMMSNQRLMTTCQNAEMSIMGDRKIFRAVVLSLINHEVAFFTTEKRIDKKHLTNPIYSRQRPSKANNNTSSQLQIACADISSDASLEHLLMMRDTCVNLQLQRKKSGRQTCDCSTDIYKITDDLLEMSLAIIRKRVKNKRKKLRRRQECVCCLDQNATVKFMPCNHMVCCQECSVGLGSCPICREPLTTDKPLRST
jgi:hypothetical protein